MPIYIDLLAKAKQLPEDLILTSQGGFEIKRFFTFFSPPVIHSQALIDARIIQKTAMCLDYYPDADDDKKYKALMGIYLFIWKQYDTTISWVLNDPLLTLLQNNLEIKALDELDETFVVQCYKELNNFCTWVFQKHDQFKELNSLYHAFPSDMQVNIQAQIQIETTPEKAYECDLSSFFINLGIKKTL